MNASILGYHWDQFDIFRKTELWPDRLKNDITCFDGISNKLGNSTDSLTCQYFVKCAWNLESEKAPNSVGSTTSNTSQWESRVVGVIDLDVTPKCEIQNCEQCVYIVEWNLLDPAVLLFNKRICAGNPSELRRQASCHSRNKNTTTSWAPPAWL